MPWPYTGVTHYHAKLDLSLTDKGRAINSLFVYNCFALGPSINVWHYDFINRHQRYNSTNSVGAGLYVVLSYILLAVASLAPQRHINI